MTVTFRQTYDDIRADYLRRLQLENDCRVFGRLCLFFRRGMVTVIIYRVSRYFMLNNLSFLAFILVGVNKVYTKNFISPLAKIGSGFVVADNGGVGLTHVLVAGKNCTFLGCSAVTLGAFPSHDYPGKYVVMGDHCVLGVKAKLIRPIQLASGTQVQANSIVLRCQQVVGAVLVGIPAKKQSIQPYEEVKEWNSLYGGYRNGFQ